MFSYQEKFISTNLIYRCENQKYRITLAGQEIASGGLQFILTGVLMDFDFVEDLSTMIRMEYYLEITFGCDPELFI